MSADVAFDREVAEAWLEQYVDLEGFLNVGCPGPLPGTWWSRCFPTTPDGTRDALDYAVHLDAGRPQGVFNRVSTLTRPVGSGGRGGARATLWVPAMYADLDYGGAGHAQRPDGAPLPATEGDAYSLIALAGLPDPSWTWHTGGGLQPYWSMVEPLSREAAEQLGEGIDAALSKAAADQGWHVDTVSADTARVLRLPGSVNRKVADQPRSCRQWEPAPGDGRLCTPADFPPPPAATPPTSNARPPLGDRGEGPFDALDRSASWADVLTPAGWTFVGTERGGSELWLRPGDPSSAYSARAFEHNLVVHSLNAGLPVGAGRRLTKGRVAAHLYYQGDLAECARDLLAAARGRT